MCIFYCTYWGVSSSDVTERTLGQNARKNLTMFERVVFTMMSSVNVTVKKNVSTILTFSFGVV